MSFKEWDPYDVLTAADVNTYLMSQVIVRCTESTRPPGVEGMHIQETDTGQHLVYKNFEWVPDGPQIQYVRKIGDETVTNSTTLQSDNHLSVVPAVWSIYDVTFRIKYNAPTAADLRIGLDLPSDCLFDGFAHGPLISATADNTLRTATLSWVSGGGSFADFGGFGGPDANLYIRGLLFTESTTGVFGLSWAQATANASATSVRSRSYMRMEYVGSSL